MSDKCIDTDKKHDIIEKKTGLDKIWNNTKERAVSSASELIGENPHQGAAAALEYVNKDGQMPPGKHTLNIVSNGELGIICTDNKKGKSEPLGTINDILKSEGIESYNKPNNNLNIFADTFSDSTVFSQPILSDNTPNVGTELGIEYTQDDAGIITPNVGTELGIEYIQDDAGIITPNVGTELGIEYIQPKLGNITDNINDIDDVLYDNDIEIDNKLNNETLYDNDIEIDNKLNNETLYDNDIESNNRIVDKTLYDNDIEIDNKLNNETLYDNDLEPNETQNLGYLYKNNIEKKNILEKNIKKSEIISKKNKPNIGTDLGMVY